MRTYNIPDLDQFFMNEAIKQAMIAAENDEVPVGAVITYQNKIIAKAYNQVELLKDPTAHAEMIAITQASNFLSSKWLYECSLYVTLEPCPMCAGAMVLARLKKISYGAADPKAGACGSIVNIIQHKKLNHHIEIQKGIALELCGEILTNFFKKQRALGKK